MKNPVSDLLANLHLGDPQAHGALTLVPLLAEHEARVDYLLLDEAIEQGLVDLTEVSDEGSVNHLKVVNRGSSKLLILDGEELVGAKQNRIANASYVVSEQSETVIPVSCIEAGRWRYASGSLSTTDSVYAAGARRAKQTDVTRSLRTTREFRSDQSAVWSTVSGYLTSTGTVSATSSYTESEASRREELDGYASAFESVPGQVGAIVLIDDRLAGMDVFGKEATWRSLSGKLLRSYAMDAVTRVERPPRDAEAQEPAAFLEAVSKAATESFDSAGEGLDVRLESPGVQGSALTFEEDVLHLTAFPREDKLAA